MNLADMKQAENRLEVRAATILLRRWGRRVRSFRLELRQGGLVLHGQAASYYTKQLAQHAAAEAAEMPIRANRIVVD